MVALLIGNGIHCIFTTRQLLREFNLIISIAEFTFDIEQVTLSTTADDYLIRVCSSRIGIHQTIILLFRTSDHVKGNVT